VILLCIYKIYNKIVTKIKIKETLLKKGTVEWIEKYLLKILCCFIFISGFIWVVITQLAPTSDPGKVYNIAMEWRRGNFSSFAEGGYLFRYPFQAGIVLFYYFLSFIFGEGNYVGAQTVNVAALVCIYFVLSNIYIFFWSNLKGMSNIIFLTFLAWPPLFLYITYMYGILPGLACSVLAAYWAIKFFLTERYCYVILSSLFIGIATVLKMNCLIFLIAIICFLFYNILDSILAKKNYVKKGIISLSFMVFLCISVWGCNKSVDKYVEQLSGYKMPEGEVLVSWIAMGLSEAELGPGFYNGYINHVFVKYNYDTEKITEDSIKEITESLKEMRGDILNKGIPFFARKTAFQWNDPTFISVDRMKFRNSSFRLPNSVQSIINGNLSVYLTIYLNYLQTLIWMGVLLYLVKNRNNQNVYELFGIVVFLGGFLFHLVWEASASYTLPYFAVIIPYAVKGYVDVVLGVEKKSLRRVSVQFKAIKLLIIVMILVVGVMFSRTKLFRNTVALDDGEDAVRQFYHLQNTKNTLENNSYYISPLLAQGYVLTDQDDKPILDSILQEEQNKRILVELTEEGIKLRCRNTEKILAVNDSDLEVITYMDDEINLFYEKYNDVGYIWNVEQVDQNIYYILYDDLALTWRNGELKLENKMNDMTQQWLFIQ
jgi:hypothetical protein